MASLKQATGNKDRPYYLKHTSVNNIVTESYVEFIITEEMAQANPGMVAGTYTLRGAGGTNCVWDNNNIKWNCDSYSPYYEANVNTIKTAFGYSTHPERCSTYGQAESGTLSFIFSASRLYSLSNLDGTVGTSEPYAGEELFCEVKVDGLSGCEIFEAD